MYAAKQENARFFDVVHIIKAFVNGNRILATVATWIVLLPGAVESATLAGVTHLNSREKRRQQDDAHNEGTDVDDVRVALAVIVGGGGCATVS
eukprot:COSAG02_NODE_5588_length_4208_cov_464.272086_2_plen_93_part_00